MSELQPPTLGSYQQTPAPPPNRPEPADLDRRFRAGVPRLHDPRPLPRSRSPITRQRSDVVVFMHGRPHKTFPPVFGTAQPPAGLSGVVRRRAYRYPDHVMRHWTLLMLADRVDVMEHRVRKLAPFVIPALVLLAAGAALKRAWILER